MSLYQQAMDEALNRVLRFDLHKHLQLQPVDKKKLPDPQSGRAYALYLHVPFCESLCPYCSFNRFLLNETAARSYFKHLRQEILMTAAQGYTFHTLYIGGGTPTILMDELTETIDLAKSLFPLTEISCETNPNHLIPEKLDVLAGRIQRLSVGVQSFDDILLAKMNRLETLGSGAEILERIRYAEGIFPVLNVDLIFNLPSQSEAILRRDLELVMSSGANQITYYPLMAAPSTMRSLQQTMGKYTPNLEHSFYELIYDTLSPQFPASSAWAFSKSSVHMIDEYIVDYGEHVGLGSGSFSYLNGTLYANTFSLSDYESYLDDGLAPLSGQHPYDRHQQMRYDFLMNFFGLEMDHNKFQQRFGLPIEFAMPIEMGFMLANGAFNRWTDEKITLSRRGRYLMIIMMREFFNGVNLLREQARLSHKSCWQPTSASSIGVTAR